MDFEGEYVGVENGPSPMMMMRRRRGAASSAFHAGSEDGEALREKWLRGADGLDVGCALGNRVWPRSWCTERYASG